MTSPDPIPTETGCRWCDPDDEDPTYICPPCRPAYEAYCAEMGARSGCGDPACPFPVTHQHEPNGEAPQWLIDQQIEDFR